MDSNQGNYFALLLKWLKVVGISLEQKESIRYRLYTCMLLPTMMSFALYIGKTVFANRHKVNVLLEIVPFAAGTVTSVVKVCIIFVRRKHVGKLLGMLQSEVFIPQERRSGEMENTLMEKWMLYANTQANMICGMTCLNLLIGHWDTMSKRLFHPDPAYWRLPYGGLDDPHSPNFEILWTYQSFAISFCGVAFVAIDSFIAGVMAYISFQLQILGNYIRSSVATSSKAQENRSNDSLAIIVPSSIEWKCLRATLKDLVQYHIAIIDSANSFEDIFNTIALINYIGMSVIVCLAAFATTAKAEINFETLQTLLFTIAAIMLQLMTAYWGNEVKLQSLAVGKACYEVDFIGSDINFQKGLQSIMQRSQIPIKFTVGKFVPLSLETFVTVMKTAYSYYMLLYNVIEQDS